MLQQGRDFWIFIVDVFQHRSYLVDLTKQDFRSRYLGSYLGLLWAFVHPAVTICLFWIVFGLGFKTVPIQGVPFILWLLAGVVPWFYIIDAITSGSGSIVEHGFLVKKVAFRVSSLPIVKILSATIVHAVFVVIVFAFMAAYRQVPGLYAVQLVYYYLCATVLLLGLTWCTSAVTVFFPDTTQIIAIVVQLGFWYTPIFWPLSLLPERYHVFFKANPAYYVIQGYRDSLLEHVWFWQRPVLTLSFWLAALSVFCLGALSFRALRPHLADVI